MTCERVQMFGRQYARSSRPTFGIPSIWTENCYSTEIRRWSTEAVINDLKHAVTHHMGIKREDSDVSVQVITKTRNYWFFDGSNMLNGKKNLNSIYRKEYIQ